MIQADLIIILPEIVISVCAMLALVGAVYSGKDALASRLVWLTAALFVLVALWISNSGAETRFAFNGMFQDDSFSRFCKVVILLAAAVVLLMGREYMLHTGLLRFEYPLLIAFAVVGMMVMVSAGDLMTLYMGLELQSLALYVVASLRRDSLRSTEAGLKYFVLGALSSGLLLYGASLTYGFSGTTAFAGIIQSAGAGAGKVSLGLLFGLVFVIAGLAFKLSVVPFHMWTPDVYEGSPTPITALFATAPKMAAIGLFARVMYDAFGDIIGDWQQIIALLALLSMFLGGIAAIGQTDIKRLMAYSSIAHMGYALIGLAAGTAEGVQSMLIYMAVYITMNLGTFAFILSMEKDGQPVTEISMLNMYVKRAPASAMAMLILLFSLAGVPPFLGFFAKLGVWRAAIDVGLVWLVVASAIASAIGAYYYLRIVFLMYFGAENDQLLDNGRSLTLTGVLMLAAASMAFGIINLFGIETPAALAAATLVN